MDFISKDKRSKIMSSIRSTGTKPEMLVRKYLHKSGYRYRVHMKGLPGRPDICFPSKKIAIFINGCFWHNHSCKDGHYPTSNIEFWHKKITANRERDKRNEKLLKDSGWKVVVIWECMIKKRPLLQFSKIERVLLGNNLNSYSKSDH